MHWAFRADASPSVGIGHLVRSLTLAATAHRRGHRCTLLTTSLPPGFAKRAQLVGVDVEPANGRDPMRAVDPDILVVDGYDLSVERLLEGFRSNPVVVALDDNGEHDRSRVDVIVNQNPHASSRLYRSAVGTPALLLGLRYALIRDEVRALRGTRRLADPSAGTIVVSMGGADVAGLSTLLVEDLADSIELPIQVVVGPANPRADELRRFLCSSRAGIAELASEHLAAGLAAAPVAILAAGGTLWEAACLGTPAVAIVVADNQAALARTPEVASFAAVHDGRRTPDLKAIRASVLEAIGDAELLRRRSRCGTELVDGLGAERTVEAVESLMSDGTNAQ